MKYMGSKSRIAKYIVPILQKTIDDNNIEGYLDCFCGGCNVIDKIKCRHKIAADKNKYLIALLDYVKNNGELYKEVNKELYDKARTAYNNGDTSEFSDWEIGNIGFLASYNGRWFDGGFAKSGYEKTKNGLRYRDYYQEAKNNLLTQAKDLKDCCFFYKDYTEWNPKNIVVYCFDKETEVLTNNGWKFFKDVDIVNDLFLSREPNSKSLEWVDAINYISYKYNGKMYSYKGRHIDICVTDNHNIFGSRLYGREKSRKEFLMNATDFATLPNNRTFIKAGGKWEGKHFDTIKIADQEFDSILFARLLGIFLTDGCINNQDNITICQSKPKIIELINELLNKLQIKYTRNTQRECTIFYLSRKYIPFFKQFYLKENRRIPYDFKNASKEIIEQLIEGIIDGDSDCERRRISVPSMGLVNDIQECLYKIGKASNYTIRKPKKSYYKKENRYITATKPHYVVSILNTEYPEQVKSNIEWTDYNDYVYCVTLSKWHTVLTRRNGCTVWMGQCDPPYQNTKQYENSLKFDYDQFWNVMRKWSENNYVFISEQNAPNDFISIWEQEVSRSIKASDKSTAVEKLFVYKNGRYIKEKNL